MMSAVEKPSSCPLVSLPDGVGLSCLARVPPSDYKALSGVSKRYRSLVVSPELYKQRSEMGLLEKVHYICLSNTTNSTSHWYILRRENAKFRLIPTPSFPPRAFPISSVLVLDWGIYVICGYLSCNVWLLDCRTHKWHELPSMRVARLLPAAGVVDGKIYVFGGCKDIDSSKWGEVFDPKTQIWDTLEPLPDRNIRLKYTNASLVIEDKVYAVETSEGKSKTLYYSPRESKWERRDFDLEKRFFSPYVLIDKLIYGCHYLGKLFWCEKEKFKWKEVKGLDTLHMSLANNGSFLSDLTNFGENIVVFWTKPKIDGTSLEISCAEISLDRQEDGDEIWGKVELSDTLITFDHVNHVTSVSCSVNVTL